MPEPQFSSTPAGANPGIAEYLSRKSDGKAQRALALKRMSLLQSLRATGIAKPATILNFNPVALRLDGGITLKVPSVIDPSVTEDARVKINYKGKPYRASVVTVREPFLYPIITDVLKPEGADMADGVGQYDMRACKQIEIAHSLWTRYNEGTPSSSGMGGVLIFEGDRHAFKSGKIDVPTFVSLPDRTREYITEPRALDEVISVALDRQRVYCEGQCQMAQVYHDDPAQKNNITPIHRVWGQYSVDMGWREKPPAWMLWEDPSPVTCEGCGATKKKATAFFCHSCSRPYDPFAAYMAGEIGIEHPSLNRIKPEQWGEIHKEEEKRRKLREPRTK